MKNCKTQMQMVVLTAPVPMGAHYLKVLKGTSLYYSTLNKYLNKRQQMPMSIAIIYY